MWYKKVTQGIEVSVRPLYRRKDSSPKENLYVWTYEVKIQNTTSETVQLINRYWQITDADGQLQKVHGPGVVGERPVIEPGKTFEYSSFTHLTTPNGHMTGHYEMVAANGTAFNIDIPRFPLRMPVRLVETVPLSASAVETETLLH